METLISYSEDEMMMYSNDLKVKETTNNKIDSSSCDNQRVPKSLPDPDLVSRSQYCADFFAEHQQTTVPSTMQYDSDEEEIPFARVVEGCEDSSDSGIESAEDSGSSSLKHQSQHSKTRRQRYSPPCASSTMIEENSASYVQRKQTTVESVQRFSPKLCSTFLDEVTPKSGHYQPISEHSGRRQPISEACSVYTWSIYDETSSTSSLEEWNVSEINGHKLVVKPPNFRHSRSQKVKVFNQESQSLYHDEEDSFAVKHLPRTSTRVCLHSTKMDDFHKVPEFKQPQHGDTTKDSSVVNKKSILKKFKKFSKSFHSQDRSSIQTLASL